MYGEQLKAIRDYLRLSQGEMAKRLEMPQATLSRYEADQIDFPASFLSKVISTFKISPDWFFSKTGEKVLSNPIKIPLLDVQASAGYGFHNSDNPAVLGFFDLERDIIRPFNPEKVAFIQVRGDSMEPTFRDGDFVAVALGAIDSNGIYVININGRLLVKRLQFIRREKIVIMSDNKVYHDEEVGPEFSDHFSIIGKVFYHLHKI